MNLFDKYNDWKTRRAVKKEGPLKGSPGNLDNDKLMEENIYQNTKEREVVKDHYRKHYWLHFLLKPVLRRIVFFISKWGNKFIQRKVLDVSHNVNLLAFEEAFDKTVQEWCYNYLAVNVGNLSLKQRKENGDAMLKGSDSVKELKIFKDLMITACVNDTAYREFFNILMFNIANSMLKKYSGKKVKHLFFTGKDSIDVQYFKLSKRFVDENLNQNRKAVKLKEVRR